MRVKALSFPHWMLIRLFPGPVRKATWRQSPAGARRHGCVWHVDSGARLRLVSGGLSPRLNVSFRKFVGRSIPYRLVRLPRRFGGHYDDWRAKRVATIEQ